MRLRRRRLRGGILVEAVLSCCFFLPMIVFLIWAVLEVCYAYVIGVNMTEASQLAAHALSDEFAKDPSIVQSESKQQRLLSRIRIPNMVSCNEQFTIPDGGWTTKSLPRSVTVTCSYLPGAGDPCLPLFPNPDPLKLAGQISIKSTSTSPLF